MASNPASDFLVTPVESLGDTEVQASKSHWAAAGRLSFYESPKPWSRFVAERVLSWQPASVLEFGCNAGRNLSAIGSRDPRVLLHGLDINAEAVQAGKANNGLDLQVGDELTLAGYPDDSFDVAFTVSVLDHLAAPGPAFEELLRVSRKAVLLLEPWVGVEGKVTSNGDWTSGELIASIPYSYSWDYQRLHSEHGDGWSLRVEPYHLDSGLGRYYELYTLVPQSQV